jgi:hypothetical protein
MNSMSISLSDWDSVVGRLGNKREEVSDNEKDDNVRESRVLEETHGGDERGTSVVVVIVDGNENE